MDTVGAEGVDSRVEGESSCRACVWCCARSVCLPACCVVKCGVVCALVGRDAAPECDAGGVCVRVKPLLPLGREGRGGMFGA